MPTETPPPATEPRDGPTHRGAVGDPRPPQHAAPTPPPRRSSPPDPAQLGESHLRVLIASAPVGIFLLVDRVFVEVNEHLCAITGYPREALLGQSTRMFFLTDAAWAEFGSTIYPRLVREAQVEFELRIPRRDGRLVDALLTCAAVDRSDLGRGVVGTVRDMTRQRREQAVLQARLDMERGTPPADLDQLLRGAIATAERITESHAGFFHRIEPDQEHLTLQTWSDLTLDSGCRVTDLARHYPLSQAGVWADCVRLRRPVIHNDFASLDGRRGTPLGHVAITREITVPVIRGGLVVAVMGVANKPTDYTEDDLASVAALADMIADRVESLRAERALHETNARLLEAQRLSRMGDWRHDLVRNTHVWSPQIYAILGLDAQTNPARLETVASRVDPEHRTMFERDLARAYAEGTPFEHEFRFLRPDGTDCFIHGRGHVERDPEGRPAALSGTLQDVTERRRSEERLRQAARVFESTSEGIVITDARGVIQAVNPAFSRITGYDEAEVLGQTPRILKSGRHDPVFYERMWTQLRESGEWRGEIWNRRKNAETYPEWLTISAVTDPEGQTCNYVAVFSDISQLKQSEERLDFLAHHDTLTGLPNRVLLQDRLEHAIRRVQRSGQRLALLFVDLDGFKAVNDTLGHAVGDQVLVVAARRLGERLRAADTLARHGGDEFLILLDDGTEAAGAAAAAAGCLSVLSEPIAIDGHVIHISASIGIALYPSDGSDAATLLQSADLAMYRAKEQGSGRYQFHIPEMTAAIQEQHALEGALRGALERGEISVAYQPQLQLRDGHLCGIEALARWAHPELGVIPPARFIPIAERIGLIGSLGDWMLAQACRQLAAWRAAGLRIPGIAVNVSSQQLERGTLLPTLHRVLAETGISAADLSLEVTESVIMGENPRVITALSDLRALGVRLVVDDFGTGSSALGRLNRLPIDRLKVHGSFIRNIGRGPGEEAIIRAIIGLGRDLGLEVMALGIEREAQSRVLQVAGCRFAQGYLFGPPMDAAALTEQLAKWPAGRTRRGRRATREGSD